MSIEMAMFLQGELDLLFNVNIILKTSFVVLDLCVLEITCVAIPSIIFGLFFCYISSYALRQLMGHFYQSSSNIINKNNILMICIELFL